MKLHTCFVSYHRTEILDRALRSYLETVSVPFTLTVVDNGSAPEKIAPIALWLLNQGHGCVLLGHNRYPGYACNRGWELAPPDADLLHRADNDFAYREGWCEEIEARFGEDPKLGQLGLIPTEIENAPANVGGNCVIRREVWEQGLRWDETPWPEFPPGWTEDSYMTPAVMRMGWNWNRVSRQVIDGLTDADPDDPYCQETYAARGISHILDGLRR